MYKSIIRDLEQASLKVQTINDRFLPMIEMATSLSDGLTRALANIEIPAIDLAKFEFPDIDLDELLVDFPHNLGGHDEQIDDVAALAIRTGIPVAWSAPPTLLSELLGAETDNECHTLLVAHQDEILGYLSDLTADRAGPWSSATSQAIKTAQSSWNVAAQSCAANVIDSIILEAYAKPRSIPSAARAAALAHAKRDIDRDQSIIEFAELMTILPVSQAYVQWYPGDPAPTSFNRHATTHCVGQLDVFRESFTIVALMFATSMARQFETELNIQLN